MICTDPLRPVPSLRFAKTRLSRLLHCYWTTPCDHLEHPAYSTNRFCDLFVLSFLNILYIRAPFFLRFFISCSTRARCTDTSSPESQPFASTAARRLRLPLLSPLLWLQRAARDWLCHEQYSPAPLSLRQLSFVRNLRAARTLSFTAEPILFASRTNTAQCAQSACLPSHVPPSSCLATCA